MSMGDGGVIGWSLGVDKSASMVVRSVAGLVAGSAVLGLGVGSWCVLFDVDMSNLALCDL